MAVDCHIHMALDGGYWKDALARHKEAPTSNSSEKRLKRIKASALPIFETAATAGTRANGRANWRKNTVSLPHAGLSDLPQGTLRKLHRPRL